MRITCSNLGKRPKLSDYKSLCMICEKLNKKAIEKATFKTRGVAIISMCSESFVLPCIEMPVL